MHPSEDRPIGPGLQALLSEAARRLRGSRRTVALTGAGMSAESGIAPFRRGSGGMPGLWERYDPMEYGTIEAFMRDPGRVWLMLRELGVSLRAARPHAGHAALARLESAGLLQGVVTQNVDGLHQAAGSRRVLELHGTWRTLRCVVCRASAAAESVDLARLPPLCACGGPLKPGVVLFGEIIPAQVIDEAFDQVRTCECLLVVGTSAEVVPAAGLPEAASAAGAYVIEVNLEETALTGRVADLALRGAAGVVLPRLADRAIALPH